jgi:hypothetical protein
MQMQDLQVRESTERSRFYHAKTAVAYFDELQKADPNRPESVVFKDGNVIVVQYQIPNVFVDTSRNIFVRCVGTVGRSVSRVAPAFKGTLVRCPNSFFY